MTRRFALIILLVVVSASSLACHSSPRVAIPAEPAPMPVSGPQTVQSSMSAP